MVLQKGKKIKLFLLIGISSLCFIRESSASDIVETSKKAENWFKNLFR